MEGPGFLPAGDVLPGCTGIAVCSHLIPLVCIIWTSNCVWKTRLVMESPINQGEATTQFCGEAIVHRCA